MSFNSSDEIEALYEGLLRSSDKVERTSYANKVISMLADNAAERTRFRDRIANPYIDAHDVILLKMLLENSERSDGWLVYATGFVILHSTCNLSDKRFLCFELTRRLPAVPTSYFSYLLEKIRDPDLLLSLVDKLLNNANRCDIDGQKRIISMILKLVDTVRPRDRSAYLDSFLARAQLLCVALGQLLEEPSLTLDEQIILHIALKEAHQDNYAFSIEGLLDLASTSETATFFVHEYLTIR